MSALSIPRAAVSHTGSSSRRHTPEKGKIYVMTPSQEKVHQQQAAYERLGSRTAVRQVGHSREARPAPQSRLHRRFTQLASSASALSLALLSSSRTQQSPPHPTNIPLKPLLPKLLMLFPPNTSSTRHTSADQPFSPLLPMLLRPQPQPRPQPVPTSTHQDAPKTRHNSRRCC